MSQDIYREKIEEMLKPSCSLKELSKDTSNQEYMCESQLQVMNFDQMPKIYQQWLKCRTTPKSNDVLYITSNDMWYFIEFKNGRIKKADVHNKIYDSIIMLIDMAIIPDFQFAREHIIYILVYNQGKNSEIEQSTSRQEIYSFMCRQSGQNNCFWGINQFEGYILKESHTYSCEEFQQNFIDQMETAVSGVM